MRATVAAILLILPAASAAQSSAGARSPRMESSLPPAGLALPPIGLTLPLIGLPLPPIGLAPASPTPTASPRPSQRGGQRSHARTASPHVIYAIPAGIYGWSATYGTPGPGPTAPSPEPPAALSPGPRPATGTLRLVLQPRPSGQLFVDTAYVGTLDELGTEFTMAEGQHHLEIRQPGFKPFTLTVRIDEGRDLVYRGDLEPAGPLALPAPPASSALTPAGPASAVANPPGAATPIARKPFYYIPGCYLGDVPPKDAGLPATCDQRLTVTYRP
ncbi:MAG: hypothetical protein ABI880_11305 [Acidobacteriota bacterium]